MKVPLNSASLVLAVVALWLRVLRDIDLDDKEQVWDPDQHQERWGNAAFLCVLFLDLVLLTDLLTV